MAIESPEKVYDCCDDFTSFMTCNDITGRLKYDPVIQQVLRPLGRGAYGLVAEVIAALPCGDGQLIKGRYAAKFLAPSFYNCQIISELPLKKKLRFQSMLKHRFFEEFSAMHNLSDHDGVVSAYRPGDFNSIHYFIMDFVSGGNLESLITDKGSEKKISTDGFIGIMLQVANILDYVHDYGIHRDLKPSNIMVEYSGKVKLTDYGMVQRINSPFLRDVFKSYGGTPSYMSPEQIRGDEVDEKTDIWAMGVIIYRYLTGDVPIADCDSSNFLGTDVYSVVEYEPIPKSKDKKHEALRKLSVKLMNYDKRKRPKNAKKVALELERIIKPSNSLISRLTGSSLF